MSAPFRTDDMRFRSPTLEQRMEPATYVSKYASGMILNTNEGDKLVYQKSKRMYDISNPGYKKRSQAGEIFNNRMYSVIEEIDTPMITSHGNNVVNGVNTADYVLYHNMPVPLPRLSMDVRQGAIDNAITDAYANVTANEGNTLLWLGEMKETLAMLKDIGGGLKNLYEITKKQRLNWARGKLSVEGQQQLTLQLLYGILPLEQQIADFLEGLFRTKDPTLRHTARGMRVDIDDTSYIVRTNGVSFRNANLDRQQDVEQHVSEHVTVVARAGVLYDLDVSDTPWLSVILEPKAVVSTAYALARLSFVIDWFINVGGTLAAWSPSAGVNELSAWVTVTIDRSQVGITRYVGADNGYRSVEGQGQFSRTTTEKWRMPINRSDLAVIPRIDLNIDLEKIAALVLLFAKVKQR